MTPITDIIAILTKHYTPTWHLGGTVKCECGENLGQWRQVEENLARTAHAAHVAAALETAGYGRIEGKTQWASRNNHGSQIAFQFNTKEAADKETARHPYDRTTVSRTVTAWKKEA